MKVGIEVECPVCGMIKAPRGRSVPMARLMCSWECSGYDQEPYSGSLWPDETEEDFGYPVGSNGTKEVSE